MTRGSGLALACAVVLVAACATEGGAPHPNLVATWGSYQKLPAERALAIAGDPRGIRWVTGASGGHSSLAEAQDGALSLCRARRAARRFQEPCVLYAVGDEIVWHGP